jgi:hypothetical protein
MYEQSSKIAKQMLDMQKVSVEGMISNTIMFWDQTGTAWCSLLNQAAWVPEEGKKAFREWIDSNKKGCETLKDAVEKGYASLERFFEKGAQGMS